MKNSKFLINITCIVLILTTLPLISGWFPYLGEFRPRLLLLGMFVCLCPIAVLNKGGIYCILYWLVYAVAFSINGSVWDAVPWFANIMEMLIPIGVINILYRADKDILYNKICVCFFFIVGLTLFLSIIALLQNPNAVRDVVGCVAFDRQDELKMLQRQGVSEYSMAAMCMVLPAIFIYSYRLLGIHSRNRILLLIAAVFVFIFMYLSHVTTTFLICIILTAMAWFMNSTNQRSIIIAGVVVVILAVAVGPQLLNYIGEIEGNDAYGSRFQDIQQYAANGQLDEDSDLDVRLYLYGKSLTAFFANPLIGSNREDCGGHAYFLDVLGSTGILGGFCFLMMLLTQFKLAYKLIPDKMKTIYSLCIFAFLVLGFVKNLAGVNYWLFMFLYIPCLIRFISKLELLNE